MAHITAEVQALLQEQQDRRKAALDAHRRDVQLAVGDEVLLDTEHTGTPFPCARSSPPAGWGRSRFTVLAQTAPNTYLLDLPPARRVVPELKVERLRPYRRRPDHLGGNCGPPSPIPGADGWPEHEVAELLWFKMRYGLPHVLVQWAGRDASGDTWEPLDNLTNCEEAIAAFEQPARCSLPRPAPPPLAAATVAPAPPFPL
jgi:hypothetical protein